MRSLRFFAIALLLLLSVSRNSTAQTLPGLILVPTTIEFDPSPDNSATSLSGIALVAEYRALYFLSSETTLNKTTAKFNISLGKPAVSADGKIRAINVFGGLIANTIYKAGVLAVGPGGETLSVDVSNPFAVEIVAAPRAWSAHPNVRGGGA